jgi:hypothetical protein
MRRSFFLIAIFIFCLAAGCTKTSQEALMDQKLCAKDTISFHEDIAPMLHSNCLPCHSASQASGSIILETYDDISGLAGTGYLLGVIKHDPGYLPMPNNGGQLSNCQIKAVETWINQGTKNN